MSKDHKKNKIEQDLKIEENHKKNHKNKKKAFTLVELIVVITILAILGTIAFISFGWYTTSARDSNRISDVKNMGVVLDNFYNKMGSYPIPSNSTWITYSGWILFYHGTFWDSVTTNVREINKTPKDPLFETEYNYSITSQKNLYEIWYVQEWKDLTFRAWNKANAAETFREVLGMVAWTFNQLMVGTSTGDVVYVLSVPSITLTDTTNTDIFSLTDKFVYKWEVNIPSNYTTWITRNWILTFQPQLIYTGSVLPTTPNQLKILIDNLKWTFHNLSHPTPLFSHPSYKNLVEIDTDNPDELVNFWEKYINKDLWWRFELKYAKNCKELLWTNDNKWDWNYIISPDWYKKLNVYCDMTTDWGGWTRVRNRSSGLWYLEWSDINKTKNLLWNELMTQYTRYWTIRVFTWWTWQDLNLAWKKFGLYYKTFKTRQWDLNGICWEHTTITDLVWQIVSWNRWTCNRDCVRVWNDPSAPCDWSSWEYVDVLLDDLWENIWLVNDKQIAWFENDPCVINWRPTWARNMSWTANWWINHRIDSSTSLTNLGWTSNSRCAWINYSYTAIQSLYDAEVSPTWFRHTRFNWVTIDNKYNEWFQTNEVYIR